MTNPVRRVALLFDRFAGYQTQVLMGIHRYVRDHTQWQLFGLSPTPSLIAELHNLRLDGAIALLNTTDIANQVAALNVSTVNVSNFVHCPGVARVGVDEFAIGRLAAEHLLDRGFRDLAYVPHSSGVFSRERQIGFFTALTEAGIPESQIHVYEKGLTSRFWQGSSDKALELWLRDLPRPVGTFAANDALAMKVVDESRRAGRCIPEDLAVIGVDNSELHCELMRPRLTSVVQPTARIGMEAATLLDHLMNGDPLPTRPLLLAPIRIIGRESTDVLAIQDHVLAKALGFIRAHATEDINVQDVIAQTGWSRRKLEDRFRLHLHRSPHEEITRVRLDTAKQLLLTTDLQLSEIARQSGFFSASRLSQVFQKQMKLSPTRFRARAARSDHRASFGTGNASGIQ